MIFDVVKLRQVLDECRSDPNFEPKQKGGDIITFCNLHSYEVARRLIHDKFFWHDKSDRPMMANEAIDFMEAHPETVSKFYDPNIAWDLALSGHLVFAALKNIPHGHIAPLYPTPEMVYSRKWKQKVPYCSNVGKENKVIGINWAFSDMPAFYLV